MSDLDALIARAQSAGVARVYKVGAVPASPSYPYAVMATSRMVPQVRTIDGSGDTPHRFTVQMFSRTADVLEDMADLMLTAFDAAYLTELDGQPQSRVEVTTPPYRDPDTSGVLNVTHTYRY